MITQNTTKKALVEKLLQDKSISLDDALVLLEEHLQSLSVPIVPNGYPQHLVDWPSMPFYGNNTLPINPDQFRTTCSGDATYVQPGSTCTVHGGIGSNAESITFTGGTGSRLSTGGEFTITC